MGKLVKQAAAAEYIGPEPALGFSTIAVRSKVRQWAHNEHNKHWLNTSSSSRMCVMNHNWSVTKQCLHLQSVAEISRHSVLSGDRI